MFIDFTIIILPAWCALISMIFLWQKQQFSLSAFETFSKNYKYFFFQQCYHDIPL